MGVWWKDISYKTTKRSLSEISLLSQTGYPEQHKVSHFRVNKMVNVSKLFPTCICLWRSLSCSRSAAFSAALACSWCASRSRSYCSWRISRSLAARRRAYCMEEYLRLNLCVFIACKPQLAVRKLFWDVFNTNPLGKPCCADCH